jgi:accessory colonization factor AcfC
LLEDIEALIKILEATFSNPNEVGIVSGELDYLIYRHCEFSIHYAIFQYLIAILDYHSKAKKATLK